jgi:hypothetical protein
MAATIPKHKPLDKSSDKWFASVVPDESPQQRLASHLLGRPVLDWVAEMREEGWTLRKIAADLNQLTHGAVDVTPETIRLWAMELTV